MYQKWKSAFEQLEKELDVFRTNFMSVKKCKCDIDECRHYERTRDRIFGDRIDQLFNMRMQVSFQFYWETINPVQKN